MKCIYLASNAYGSFVTLWLHILRKIILYALLRHSQMPSSGLIDLEGFQNDFIRLPSKPSARLSYSFRPQSQGETGSGQPQRLLIFLSGIDNRSKSWQAAIASFIRLSQIRRLSIPPILIYDRYGIGLSDRHPSETDKHSKLRYSILEAMYDLHELVVQIALEKLGYKEAEVHRLNIVFASHSMGCFIARLYAQEYPGTVEALLLIDSGISNTAVQDFVPDPDRPTHVYKYNVPSDVTPDMCRLAIQRIMKSPFNFYGRNREGMYWGNSPELLPHNDAPRLRGPRSGLPLVTVVVNDPEVMNKSFAKASRNSTALKGTHPHSYFSIDT